MADMYKAKDTAKMNEKEIQAEYQHVMDLFKLAQVSHGLDVKKPDGKTEFHHIHKLPDFLERFLDDKGTVNNDRELTDKMKKAYMDANRVFYAAQRLEKEGKLSTRDQQQFLETVNRALKVEERTPMVANSLGFAEEVLRSKIKTETQKVMDDAFKKMVDQIPDIQQKKSPLIQPRGNQR